MQSQFLHQGLERVRAKVMLRIQSNLVSIKDNVFYKNYRCFSGKTRERGVEVRQILKSLFHVLQECQSSVDSNDLQLLNVFCYVYRAYRYFVWLTYHMVATCKPANAKTIKSRFGPVAAVSMGMLLAMVFSMNHASADAVHKNAA